MPHGMCLHLRKSDANILIQVACGRHSSNPLQCLRQSWPEMKYRISINTVHVPSPTNYSMTQCNKIFLLCPTAVPYQKGNQTFGRIDQTLHTPGNRMMPSTQTYDPTPRMVTYRERSATLPCIQDTQAS